MQGLRGQFPALSKTLLFAQTLAQRSSGNASSLSSTGGIRSLDLANNTGNVQQWRGIRVKVRNGNLDDALRILQRKMISSGMERLIRNVPRYHLKDSEKRILADKRRCKIQRAKNLSTNLKKVLIHKVRGL